MENYLDVRSPTHSMLNLLGKDPFLDPSFNIPINSKPIEPKPGFCIKSKTDDNSKIFINVCHSPEIPEPPNALLDMKFVEDCESIFRFPLSVGEPHNEKDKKGEECTCYDIIVNSNFFEKIRDKQFQRDSLVSIACSSLREKYKINIVDDACTFLNKPYHGKMPKHFIKSKPTPLDSISKEDKIVMPTKSESFQCSTTDDSQLMTAVKTTSFVKSPKEQAVVQKSDSSKVITPSESSKLEFQLFQIPSKKPPQALIFEAFLPSCQLNSCKSVDISVCDDKLSVKELNCDYKVDIVLPNAVIPEKCKGNFICGNLTVFLPLKMPKDEH